MAATAKPYEKWGGERDGGSPVTPPPHPFVSLHEARILLESLRCRVPETGSQINHEKKGLQRRRESSSAFVTLPPHDLVDLEAPVRLFVHPLPE